MPQLIAMIIVVVGALIYMFQTFGGTGDKIEGIAQKSSVLTEIANVKNGIQLALRAGDIKAGTTMKDLANLGYFASQMNDEISDNNTSGNDNKGTNAYSAISFGGEDSGALIINLLTPADTASVATTNKPGILVTITGTLDTNKKFLEAQIANDLSATASIYKANAATFVADPSGTINGTDSDNDGVFAIYYKDLPTGFITE